MPGHERLLVGFWLAVSALVHLALIYWVPVVGAQPRTFTPPEGAGQRVPLTVRLVGVDALRAQAIRPEPPAPPPGEARPADAAPIEPSPVRVAQSAPQTGALVLAGPAPDEDYLPRARLTVAPEPTTEIIIPDPGVPPGTEPPPRASRVILTVFINEAGGVDRIRVETPDPEASIELAARKAFGNARFAPGEVHGKAVKSRMRIEVGLEPLNP